MTPAEGADSFAAMLRELKDRTGQSYGVLAKRMHVSTSTLHRYCNGDAVPHDYGPVERFARLCGAQRGELVELHRRWVLADATRGTARRTAETANAEAAAPDDSAQPSGAAPGNEQQGAAPPPQAQEAQEAPPEAPNPPGPPSDPPPGKPDGEPDGEPDDDGEPAVSVGAASAPRRRLPGRRPLLAGAVAAAAVVTVAVAATVGSGSPDDGRGGESGTAAHRPGPGAGPEAGGTASAPASPSPSKAAKGQQGGEKAAQGEASASAGSTPSGGGRGERDGSRSSSSPGSGGADTPPVSLSVRPYAWDEQKCQQTFLINRAPGHMPGLPSDDMTTWARGLGGVDAKKTRIGVTVRGTGKRPVVLEALRAKVVSRGPALAWRHYDPGIGCGSGVTPASYEIGLDNVTPQVKPVQGWHLDKRTPAKPFPLKVTADDPEVLAVTAGAANCDCRWYLELDWSSGRNSGTMRIDDGGSPFRTSGVADKDTYSYYSDPGRWQLEKP
ncbi:helix-turn-helix domain-containing protein [Streptomyces boncukensis]|uniref:Helix-turn-helix domain-containing protein n=1 Tax=Streptomyces boncukensis TaxID=2711219 RepID=A0A6G4WSX5_9ACTN|nr:helix-turn-helix transcriptional regulator [Streptomyces boncukensis]NGO68305.1 helix-turn-helix domain-containing protein [Streptomyces boncukensis]